MPQLFVVMPVFNEPSTLAPSLARVRAATVSGVALRVILVDDGSDAETRAQAESLRDHSATDGGVAVELIRHPANRGKGAAIRTGFARALEIADEGDLVLVQDADLEYDPADFAALARPALEGSADLVLGNRWATAPKGMKRAAHRMLNGFLTLASNVMTGLRVADMECCLKLFTVPALRRVLPELDEERFGIEPQIVASAARNSLRVREVPVRYEPRGFDEGKKIRMKDGLRVFVVLWRERRRRPRPDR